MVMSELKLRGYWNYCGLNLMMLSRVWEKHINDCLTTYDLSLRQLMILRLVASTPDISPGELSRYIGEGPTGVGKHLGKLQKKGLIERPQVQSGRRVKEAQLTDEGKELLTLTDEVLHRQEENFLGHLPRATRQGVNLTIENILDRKIK